MPKLKGVKQHPCSFELNCAERACFIPGLFIFMFMLYEQFLNPHITITDLRRKIFEVYCRLGSYFHKHVVLNTTLTTLQVRHNVKIVVILVA